MLAVSTISGICLPARAQTLHQGNEDSILWRMADRFAALFNEADTAAMGLFLPQDFMMQWMHENFLGRKGLFGIMSDTAVHRTFKHRVAQDAEAILLYSDDHTAACLNARYIFLDPAFAASLNSKHGYGLCIMYFSKINGEWVLKTVHLDLHCSLCDL